MDAAAQEGGGRGSAFRFVAARACAMCGALPGAFRRMGRRLDGHQGLAPARRPGVAVTVVRCGACGLVFPDPMPLPASVEALYGVAPAEYWPADYLQSAPGYMDGQCAIARDLLGGRAGLAALDVGAGIGKGVLALERNGFRAVGLEPSRAFRVHALRHMGLRPDQIIPGSVEDAELPPASFDYVHCGAVLEHVPEPGRALGRVLTWTRPGGIVHAEVPSAAWLLGRGMNAWYRVTGQGFVTNTSPMHPPYHLYEFTVASFRAAAASLPCALERHEVWRGDVLGPRVLHPLWGWLMDATGTGMQLAVWLRKR